MCKLLFQFTNLYEKEQYSGFESVDVRDLSGTDLYCDEVAQQELLAYMKPYGIHLIDSGNYHYMSRLFTKQLCRPYQLLVFDHHTDMKPAMFDMLSCGSWAREVLLQDDYLQQLILVGPPAKSMEEIPEECRATGKLICISEEELQGQEELLGQKELQGQEKLLSRIVDALKEKDIPLYISVDKDVLSSEETVTNWDQGNVTMARLMEMIEAACKECEVLGADICGGSPQDASALVAKMQAQTDHQLIQLFQKYYADAAH